MAFAELNIFKLGLSFPWGRKYTDFRVISHKIVGDVYARGERKIFHYMGFVPNVLYFLEPRLFARMEKGLTGRHKRIDVKILCLDEASWCSFLKEHVYLKLSGKERGAGVWERYKADTFAFVRRLRALHGEDVIHVAPAVPYHLAITERFGYVILHDSDVFRNAYKESPDPVNILGLKISEKEPQIKILKNRFNEYYPASVPLDLDKFFRNLEKVG